MFKKIFVTLFLVALIIGLFVCDFYAEKKYTEASMVYQVYLDGKVIGYINDDEELYALINNKQEEIRKKYNVENVYPPEDLKIIKTNKYNVDISSAEVIYDKMAQLDSFTIEGYIVTFKSESNNVQLNILDKNVFESALKQFVYAFVSTDEYNNYLNGTQPKISTVGKIIDAMYFDENITIKKGYISVYDYIYTDEYELTQYLLFGKDFKIKTYTVKAGDTIASISDAHHLNVQEFLIANSDYNSEDNLLAIGAKVNTTLIDPVITLSYEVTEVRDMNISYNKKIVYDNNVAPTYSEVTTPGVDGVTRITERYIVKNGETQAGVVITNSEVIIEKVDEIITRGRSNYHVGGTYVDDGTEWGWPTNQPYVITSRYSWRKGKLHEGLDISGTGYGSPIYAAQDGTVVYADNCNCSGGWRVYIEHANGYYTTYAHLAPHSITVTEGEFVRKGQVVGRMGQSGLATGPHLHFAFFKGFPNRVGSQSYNPCQFYRGKC